MRRPAVAGSALLLLAACSSALAQTPGDERSGRRLTSPVDDGAIERRIDLGATAAGEQSAVQPDLPYGAFQRGHFLTAFALALERAKAGDAKAQTLLGELLSRGLGVKQDFAEAAEWYGLAAKQGDREALYALGRAYLDGRGVTRDPAKAADHFQQAAEKGSAIAWRELAYLLLQGEGREKNALLAAAYLRKAARAGDMDAQFALAGLYTEGVGVVADEKQAARWYAEAARNGHVGAQVEYGIILFNGRGVPKDEAVAAAWFQQAASTDNPLAQVRLARLLADGRGVKKDPAAAARWYLIAKAKGFSDEYLDDWIERLSTAERDEAQAAANRWLGPPANRSAQAANAATKDTAKDAPTVDNAPE